eukprot:356469-Chlamydomonas_euryale.AAC.1
MSRVVQIRSIRIIRRSYVGKKIHTYAGATRAKHTLCGHAIRWHASFGNPSAPGNKESDGEGSSRKRKLPVTGFARPYAARSVQLHPTSRAATLIAISDSNKRRKNDEKIGGPHNQPVDLTTVGTLQASASNAKKPMPRSIRAFASTAAQQQGASKALSRFFHRIKSALQLVEDPCMLSMKLHAVDG